MAQFPSNQFFLSLMVGTGTATDPRRPAIKDDGITGSWACIPDPTRSAYSICIVEVQSQQQLNTFTKDNRNVWLRNVDETTLHTVLANSDTDFINQNAPRFITGYVPLPYGLTGLEALENLSTQIAGREAPGGKWWPYV